MNQIILHRSLGSPYAEKIIAALNYVEIPWKSVIAPKGAPRPIQEMLVGNYSRRIPILQIGSDIYCDTDLIMSKISELSKKPELSSHSLNEEDVEFMHEVEFDYANAVLGGLSPFEFVIGYFRNIPFFDALAFIKDRLALKKTEFDQFSSKPRKEWKGLTKRYLNEVNTRLCHKMFLSGNETPNYLDFSVFTHVWYLDFINGLKLASNHDYLKSWLIRMKCFAENRCLEVDSAVAIECAKNTLPKSVNESMLKSSRIGKEIEFQPNDSLGQITESITGILVGENDYQLILKNSNNKVGEVHVHFPKVCFGACG